MAYTRMHWTNNLTQLNAKNMNNIEDGIEENAEHINALAAIHTIYSDPDSDGNIVITLTDV